MCKHLNCELAEEYIAFGRHTIADGKYIDSLNDDDRANLISRIRVECDDCGLSKFYTYKNRPKWLINYMKQVTDNTLK
jgi:RNase P subunit RPR2